MCAVVFAAGWRLLAVVGISDLGRNWRCSGTGAELFAAALNAGHCLFCLGEGPLVAL